MPYEAEDALVLLATLRVPHLAYPIGAYGTSYGHSSNPRASSGHRRCGGRIGKSCPLAVSVLFSSHFAADVIDVLQMPIDLIVKIDDCLGPRHFTSSAPAVQIATSYSSCFSHTLCVVSPRSAISASLKSPNGQQPGTYNSQPWPARA